MGVNYGGSSALVTPREDLGLGFDAIDLAAMEAGYVGFQIAPIIEAQVAFGQFRKMNLGQMLQPRKTDRNSDGSFKRISADFDVDTFQTKDHGLEMAVDYRDSAIYAAMIDSEMVASDLTRMGMIEAHENRVIAAVDALTGDSTTASTNEFDDTAADLASDFAAYKRLFRLACGFKPNCLCVDTSIVDKMMENTSIQDKFIGSASRTARDIRLQGLAAALGLDEVIEANSVKNTVASPKAPSLATSWTEDNALLFRKSTAPTTLAPQFMRTIHWSGNGSRPGCSFEQYEEPQKDGTVIRARLEVQEKVIYAACALLITNVKT